MGVGSPRGLTAIRTNTESLSQAPRKTTTSASGLAPILRRLGPAPLKVTVSALKLIPSWGWRMG